MTRFQDHLLEFRTAAGAEEIVHPATIDQFARFDSDRRHRFNATKGGIPDV
ncbi:hypothetical protein ACIA5E_29690 [Nocardia asteroides]|uniref:hypothetical protein n=1 Tax=Nocardia asteroides TaxID=1824 RepID=UPI0037B7A835